MEPGTVGEGPVLLPGGQGIRIGGWVITARKAPIIGEALIEEYTRQLDNVLTLPEMLYGNSSVALTHAASGVSLTFNALDALRAWRQEDLPPLRVSGAHAWQQARKEEISRQEAAILEYDWTYTTAYAGTLTAGPPPLAPAAAAPVQPVPAVAVPPSAIQPPQQPQQPGANGHAAPAPPLPQWVETEEQLDRALLLARDPILFYAEVPLYESELDDNGVCQMGVRLRVMPRCWFLCLRLWLRVDSCLVRLREARVMCRFEAPNVVLRELRHSEGSAAELRAAGVPMSGRAYDDADAAAAAFSAVAPACARLYQLQRLDLAAAEGEAADGATPPAAPGAATATAPP